MAEDASSEFFLLWRKMPLDRRLAILRAMELHVHQGVSFEVVSRLFYDGCNDPTEIAEIRIAELRRRYPDAFKDEEVT